MESTQFLGVTCILLALLAMVRAQPSTVANFLTLSNTSPQTPNFMNFSCLQDLEQNEDYIKCSQSMLPLMQGIMQAVNMSAESAGSRATQMFTAFCTPEGREGLRCMMDYVLQCPEMRGPESGDQGDRMSYQEMMDTGAFDAICESYVSETCRPILMACTGINESSSILEQGMKPILMPTSAGSTPSPVDILNPYSMVPSHMTVLCGPMRDLLNCISDLEEECPKTAQFMEKKLKEMYTELGKQEGMDMPLFYESKEYIMESCPRLPSDFSVSDKQKCIRDSLAKPEFQECYQNAYSNDNCDFYFGGKACIMEHVGMDCGEAYAQAIGTDAPLFIHIPSGCDEPTGGVSSHKASVTTMIGATALLLLGRF